MINGDIQWLITISENEYDSVMTYIINEKDIPVGLTLNDLFLKIVLSIAVNNYFDLECIKRVNEVSYVVELSGYHYDITLQEAKDFVLDISGELAKPIKDKKHLNALMDKLSYKVSEDVLKDVENAASIKGVNYSFA